MKKLILIFVFASLCLTSCTISYPPYSATPVTSINNERGPLDIDALVEKYPQLSGMVISAPDYMEELERINREAEKTGKEGEEAYRLDKGLLIKVEVWGEPELSRQMQIRPDGKIDYPLIGEVKAEGLTIKEFKALLTEKLSQFIIDPQVLVHSISSLNVAGPVTIGSSVTVMSGSEIRSVQIAGNERLSIVLGTANAFSDDSEWRQIRVIKRRPGTNIGRIVIVDWLNYIKYGDFRQDIPVKDGDIVFIPTSYEAGDSIFADWDLILRYMNNIISTDDFRQEIRKRF